MNLAFYRTFGIPRIAKLLASTGEITHRTHKRADDTGLIMYLLIYYGFEHPRGQSVLSRLVRMHQRHQISNADYLYVLACVAVIPTRWIAQHGHRPLTSREIHATYQFYSDLGRRMGLIDIPSTYAELEAFLDAYDDAHMRDDEAGVHLMQASRELLTERFPRWLRPVADRCAGAMLDPRLRRAVRISEPSGPVRLITDVLLRLQSTRARRRRPQGRPSFDPDAAVRSYPSGYKIEDLGPADL